MPAVFMGSPDRVTAGPVVVEPEVLDSLDDVRPAPPHGTVKPLGCAVGPGCGCIGVPLALVAGLAVSSLLALAWVLRLGRAVGALSRIVARHRAGAPGRRGSGTA